ncbi:hypothetical protein E3U55_14630 [Filobacillus milosensis]|uniref:Uncharacterized protein n=2 Tax=Filobacillus milosensis TaxID=94137 RepID=A0A4Y8IDY2_9BACI|nr:hypothetical protein E3U55_14630 [Filobacillus milosensis]
MISLNIYNEYREKGLGEVIEYDTSDVEELVFYEGHPPYNWKTDEVEHADALKEFLSQYRVKKMSDDEWNTNVSKEKGFQVTIYLEDKIIMSTIYENRLMVLGSSSGSIFKVTNGPIDVEWVENYLKKHRN